MPIPGLIKLADYVDVEQSALEMASKKIVACNENDNMMAAIGKIIDGAYNVAVIKPSGEFIGFIAPKDALGFLCGLISRKAGLLTKTRDIARQTPAFEKKHSIRKALEVFKKLGEGAHPVLAEKKLTGVIRERDFIRHINKKTGVRVGDLMVRRPIVAKEHYKIKDLARMMFFGFSNMPVQKDGLLVGMITPKEILGFMKAGQGVHKLKYEEAETKHAANIRHAHAYAKMDVLEAVQLMRTNSVSALPVVQDEFGKLEGIITERDILDALI